MRHALRPWHPVYLRLSVFHRRHYRRLDCEIVLQRRSPLDLRVVDSVIGSASSESEAREINERLAVLNDWFVDKDETRQSLAWKEWLKIARPDQLPPQFDPNWREWRIQGDRGSGKTTAAVKWIASQLGNQSTLVYVISEYASQSDDHAAALAGQSGMNFTFPREKTIYFESGALARTYDMSYLDDLTRASFGPSEILWLDGLLLPPRHLIGKMHSFAHAALRSRARVIWSG